MKVMIIDRYGKVLMCMVEVFIFEINEYEVFVEIYVVSINLIDFKICDGKVKMLLKYEMFLIFGNDFVGVIMKVGLKVICFKVGDEIYVCLRKNKIGIFVEYIVIYEDDIVLKLKNLSFEEVVLILFVGLILY